MSVQLAIEPRAGYLRFEISGTRAPGQFARDILHVWARIADECQTKGISRVLGVSNLKGHALDTDMYAIGSKLPRVVGGRFVRAAVVVHDQDALGGNRFGEDVAVNRGLPIRVFSDEASALTWLTT